MEINAQVVKKLILQESIYSVFQPVINLKTRRIVAVEALCRGLYNGEIIPPYYLFDYAKKLGGDYSQMLDRIAQKKAMYDYFNHPIAPMLVLNMDPNILNNLTDFSQVPIEHLNRPDISPKSIVLEATYKCVENAKFSAFLQYMRFCGHQISLDSIDDNLECLSAISKIRPDYIKIDRDFVIDIEKKPAKQELLNSITDISKKYGACTIAEGVETMQEVTTCMLCGVDLVQGFYFTLPTKLDEFPEEEIRNKITFSANNITESLVTKYNNERSKKLSSKELINELLVRLASRPSNEYEDIMYNFIGEYREIECIYLIDGDGKQISDTIMLAEALDSTNSMLFAPAVIGDMHSLKNYFYAVVEDIENPFISEKYTSNATGNLCITVSSKFVNINKQKIIVCLDIKAR